MSLPAPYYTTSFGAAYLGDGLELVSTLEDESVDLIMTSPPFGLRRKKEYGNVDAQYYVRWFLPFGGEFRRVLKKSGSLVIDIGGSWNPGLPTKSLYNFDLLLALCRDLGFHLAQDFYWFNPAKLPSPAEWVTVRRIRAKDAVDTVWWLSKSASPWAGSMENVRRRLRKHGRTALFRDLSSPEAGSALVVLAGTRGLRAYLKACRKTGLYPYLTRGPGQQPPLLLMLMADERPSVLDGLCGCQEPGVFRSGLFGILAGPPDEKGARYIERCDTCEYFASDEEACVAYVLAMSGTVGHDSEGRVVWFPP